MFARRRGGRQTTWKLAQEGLGLHWVGVILPLESFSMGTLLMAHLVCMCPLWQLTYVFPMDVAAPSPDARTICRLVCALLPAITFPVFLQFACVLLGQPRHSLRCGRPVLPAYVRAALP